MLKYFCFEVSFCCCISQLFWHLATCLVLFWSRIFWLRTCFWHFVTWLILIWSRILLLCTCFSLTGVFVLVTDTFSVCSKPQWQCCVALWFLTNEYTLLGTYFFVLQPFKHNLSLVEHTSTFFVITCAYIYKKESKRKMTDFRVEVCLCSTCKTRITLPNCMEALSNSRFGEMKSVPFEVPSKVFVLFHVLPTFSSEV